MEKNIKLASTQQHLVDIQQVGRNMVEKTLQMRCLAYMHQVKYELLLSTVFNMSKGKKELSRLADSLLKQVCTTEEQKELIKKQSVELQEQMRQLQESEERYQRSLEFAAIGAWDWNIVTGVFLGSSQISSLLGYELGKLETTHDRFISTIHPDDRDRVQDAMNRCIELGEEFGIEHRIIYPNGDIYWLLERGDVVRDENGVACRMLGVAQDITERHLAHKELKSFNKIMMAREERIIELKEEVNRMATELGRSRPYPPLWNE